MNSKTMTNSISLSGMAGKANDLIACLQTVQPWGKKDLLFLLPSSPF